MSVLCVALVCTTSLVHEFDITLHCGTGQQTKPDASNLLDSSVSGGLFNVK